MRQSLIYIFVTNPNTKKWAVFWRELFHRTIFCMGIWFYAAVIQFISGKLSLKQQELSKNLWFKEKNIIKKIASLRTF